MTFKIMIPTRGRVGDQQTLKSLSALLRRDTILVCPANERDMLIQHAASKYVDHEGGQPVVLAQPDTVTTIAAKRKWMMEWARENGIDKVLMLDDDLFFYYRYWKQEAKNGEGDWRLNDSYDEMTTRWITELMDRITPEVPHGGFGPRQGNNNFPDGWLVGGARMMLALAYHVPTALDNAVWDRISFREDMDVALQLLRKGFPNVITHDFCVGQKSYAAPGGCDQERTTEKSDADAYKLAELHPGFVKVVAKEYLGHPRKEVIVQWKRALLSSGYTAWKL